MDTKITEFTGPPTFYFSHKSISLKQGYYIDGIEEKTIKFAMKVWENAPMSYIKYMVQFKYIILFSYRWKIT